MSFGWVFLPMFLLFDFWHWKSTATTYEQRTKPITSAKGRGWNGHRFLCVPHRSWGFNVCNKIRGTCVSRVIVFCVTPIVPESFMMVSSIKYQCPGVTVPKCRRFWRALMSTPKPRKNPFSKIDHRNSCNNSSVVVSTSHSRQLISSRGGFTLRFQLTGRWLENPHLSRKTGGWGQGGTVDVFSWSVLCEFWGQQLVFVNLQIGK